MSTTNSPHHSIKQTLTRQLQITTLNVNILHNGSKRQGTFESTKNKKVDIVVLQETQSSPNAAEPSEKEWKGKSY